MQRDTRSFIVRIWHDGADDVSDALTWRGSIEVVGREQRFYFSELDSMVGFIREQAGLTSGSRWSLPNALIDWIKHLRQRLVSK